MSSSASRILAVVIAFCLLAVAAPAANAALSCGGDSGKYVRASQSINLTFSCFDDSTFDQVDTTMTLAASPQPQHAVSISGPTAGEFPGQYVFTYNADSTMATGVTDTFTVHAVDKNDSNRTADVDVTLNGEGTSDNHAPSCTDFTTADNPNDISTDDYVSPFCQDAENDPVSYSVTRQGSLGTADVSTLGGRTVVHYKANSGASGDDNFDYKVEDGHGGSQTLTHYVHITPPAPPSCPNQTINVRPGGTKSVTPLCNVSTQESYTLSIVSAPDSAHGTTTTNGSSITYQDKDGTSPVTITYRATGDHSGQGPTATITVNVADVNTPPSCFTENEDITLRAGDQTDLAVDCFDDDGDPVTTTKSGPELGGFIGDLATNGGFSEIGYQAPSSASTDHVTFTGNDGRGGSTPVTITIHVEATDANNNPQCTTPVTLHAVPGAGSSFVPVPCSDPDDDALTDSIGQQPTQGTVTVRGFGIFYTPNDNASGNDTFTINVTDNRGTPQTVTINVTIDAPDKPTCTAPAGVTLRAGTAVPVFPSRWDDCTEQHAGNLQLKITSTPEHGTIKMINGDPFFVAEHTGTDQVTMVFSNSGVDSDPITQTFTVNEDAENAPECFIDFSDDTLTIAANKSRTLGFSCSDTDGDPITAVPTAAHGQVTIVDKTTSIDPDTGQRDLTGTMKYTAPASGTSDTITLGASDGKQPATGRLSLPVDIVAASDLPKPFCRLSGVFTVRQGASIPVHAICSAPATDDPISLSHEAPSHGSLGDFTLTRSGDVELEYTATYTAASDYLGWVALRATPHAGSVDGGATTMLVKTINGSVNHAPTCDDDAIELQAGHGALLNPEDLCSDADSDPVTLAAASGPGHGKLVGPNAEGNYTFLADADFTGQDTMTLTASDGHGGTATVHLDITVDPDHSVTVTEQTQPGDTVGNAVGVNPSPTLPVVAEVTTPTGGLVTVTEQKTTATPPSGISFFGREFHIDAPAATEANPLKLVFSIYQAELPDGTTAANIKVLRDNVAIADCTAPTVAGTTPLTATDDNAFTTATPDGVCIARRQTLGDGSVRVVILSAHASTWNFGAAATPTTGGGGGNTGGTTGNSGGGGAVPTTKPPVVTPKDTIAPRLTLKLTAAKLKTILAKGLTVRPGCSEACFAAITVTISGKDAKKLHLNKKKRTTVVGKASSKGKPVRVKLSAKARRALKKVKKITLRVTIQAVDLAGNRARPVSKTITIRR